MRKRSTEYKKLPPELLHELLDYEPDTGILTWKAREVHLFNATEKKSAEHSQRRWNTMYAGKQALIALRAGYPSGSIFDICVSAHRVIWAMQTGEWPETTVDHEDGDKKNNRWKNLRLADRSQQQHNRRNDSVRSKTGYIGVIQGPRGRVRAKIGHNGSIIDLGAFDTAEEAALARDRKCIELRGKFAVLNFPEHFQ
jgi:hypothetical protein